MIGGWVLRKRRWREKKQEDMEVGERERPKGIQRGGKNAVYWAALITSDIQFHCVDRQKKRHSHIYIVVSSEESESSCFWNSLALFSLYSTLKYGSSKGQFTQDIKSHSLQLEIEWIFYYAGSKYSKQKCIWRSRFSFWPPRTQLHSALGYVKGVFQDVDTNAIFTCPRWRACCGCSGERATQIKPVKLVDWFWMNNYDTKNYAGVQGYVTLNF